VATVPRGRLHRQQLREFIHRLKPLTIAGLVTAYEQAIDESQASYDGRRR